MESNGTIPRGSSDTAVCAGMLREGNEQAEARNMSPEDRQTMYGDIARGLAQSGVSLSVIMSTFGSGIFSNAQNELGRQAAQQFQQSMIETMRSRDEEMRGRMRDVQDRMRRETSGARKRELQLEYDQLLSEYGRQMGGGLASIADAWARGEAPREQQPGGRSVQVGDAELQNAAAAHAQQIIDLHTGRLDRVVPGRAPPRMAA